MNVKELWLFWIWEREKEIERVFNFSRELRLNSPYVSHFCESLCILTSFLCPGIDHLIELLSGTWTAFLIFLSLLFPFSGFSMYFICSSSSINITHCAYLGGSDCSFAWENRFGYRFCIIIQVKKKTCTKKLSTTYQVPVNHTCQVTPITNTNRDRGGTTNLITPTPSPQVKNNHNDQLPTQHHIKTPLCYKSCTQTSSCCFSINCDHLNPGNAHEWYCCWEVQTSKVALALP